MVRIALFPQQWLPENSNTGTQKARKINNGIKLEQLCGWFIMNSQKRRSSPSTESRTLIWEENLTTKPPSRILITSNISRVSSTSNQSEDLIFHPPEISLKSI